MSATVILCLATIGIGIFFENLTIHNYRRCSIEFWHTTKDQNHYRRSVELLLSSTSTYYRKCSIGHASWVTTNKLRRDDAVIEIRRLIIGDSFRFGTGPYRSSSVSEPTCIQNSRHLKMWGYHCQQPRTTFTADSQLFVSVARFILEVALWQETHRILKNYPRRGRVSGREHVWYLLERW